MKNPKVARASAIAVRLFFFCLSALAIWYFANEGRLSIPAGWSFSIFLEQSLGTLAVCLFFDVILNLISEHTSWEKTAFLTRGNTHEFSDVFGLAANLGVIAGALIAALTGHRDALALIPLGIARVAGALGSIAILTRVFVRRARAG